MNGPAKVGIVPYLNAKPMIDRLDQFSDFIKPVYDVPSRLALMLREKRAGYSNNPFYRIFKKHRTTTFTWYWNLL